MNLLEEEEAPEYSFAPPTPVTRLTDMMEKATLDDGCKRDETGFVAPEKVSIKPIHIEDKTSDIRHIVQFPIGTPDEDIMAYQPPPQVLDAWKKVQQQWKMKAMGSVEATTTTEKETEEQMNKNIQMSRQERRKLERKQKKEQARHAKAWNAVEKRVAEAQRAKNMEETRDVHK